MAQKIVLCIKQRTKERFFRGTTSVYRRLTASGLVGHKPMPYRNNGRIRRSLLGRKTVGCAALKMYSTNIRLPPCTNRRLSGGVCFVYFFLVTAFSVP